MPHTRTAGSDEAAQALDIDGTQIRQLVRLEIAPQQFDGVGIGRIGAKRFDLQPRVLRRKVGLHTAAFVGAETIPDQHDALAAEMPLQMNLVTLFRKRH